MNQREPSPKTLLVSWAAVAEMPFGRIGIQTAMYEQSLVLSNVVYLGPKEPLIAPQNQLAESAIQQINQYCQDPNYVFNIPIIHKGTSHQQRVWQAIEKIPRGQVMTYGELAKKIKSAPRAVGGACAANPYPLIVPCHRIVAANGIGGFARQNERGYHRNIKQWLLAHEGALSHES
jgi:methylated-DNA-[protein]-cysteine S-methyltransferase